MALCDFASAETVLVLGDPDDLGGSGECRVDVSHVDLLLGIRTDGVGKVGGEVLLGGAVGGELGVEDDVLELAEDATPGASRGGCWSKSAALGVDAVLASGVASGVASLNIGGDLGGQVVVVVVGDQLSTGNEITKGLAHGDVEEDGEDGEDDHDDQGTSAGGALSTANGEQTNQTELGEVDTGGQLLEGTGVRGTLHVNVGANDKQHLVAEGQVQQTEADGGETKQKRGDARVGDGNDTQVGVDGVDGAPADADERRVAVEDLAGRLVEDLAEEEHEDEGADVQDLHGGGVQAVQDKVGNVEVGGLGQVLGEQRGRRAGVFGDGLARGGGARGKGGDQKDLDDLKGKVPRLRLELDGGARGLEEGGEQAAEDGHQRHQHGQHDRRQQTRDNAEDDGRDVGNPRQPADGLEVLNVGDGADKGDGDGPEDDHEGDEGGAAGLDDGSLGLLDGHVLPDDLVGRHAHLLGRHLGRLLLDRLAEGGLGRCERVELDKDAALFVRLVCRRPVRLNLALEGLNLRSGPVDRVDLLANQELELVRGAVLFLNVEVLRLPVLDQWNVLRLALLLRLFVLLDQRLAQLVLARLELDGRLVSLLDHLLQLFAVGLEPDVAHAGKQLAEGSLAEEVGGHVGEEDGAAGHAADV